MLPFRVTICGLDELSHHCSAGVTHVLSILDPDWPPPEALLAYDPHARLELRFHDVIEPQNGWIAPPEADVARLLAFGRELPRSPPAHLLLHCHAGVSRSTAAAIVILAQASPQLPAAEVVRAVVALRPRAWPNLRILELGDAQLGRGGEVVAAAGAHYRRALEREPGLAEAMIAGGRGREVALTGGIASTS
jgi:predicted protein tyrosine phosphatase